MENYHTDISRITKNFKNYDFRWKTILYSMFWWPKINKFKCYWRTQEHYNQFKSGADKLIKDLDVQQILKSVRTAKILANLILDEDQKILMEYQPWTLIENNDEPVKINDKQLSKWDKMVVR